MSDFMRLAAYTFLALTGLWAWNTLQDGWRYYFGIALFIVSTLRILTILRQRMALRRAQPGAVDGQPPQADDANAAEE